jgi:hypothetical protein
MDMFQLQCLIYEHGFPLIFVDVHIRSILNDRDVIIRIVRIRYVLLLDGLAVCNKTWPGDADRYGRNDEVRWGWIASGTGVPLKLLDQRRCSSGNSLLIAFAT